MKTKFRYDYNCKMLIIYIFVSLLFLLISVTSYDKSLIAFLISTVVFLICLLNTIVLIYNQGITVRKKNILIIDYFWFTKIDLIDLNKVELKEIKKSKKNNFYGFIHEFYHPSTYMYKCDYVYNNGKVYNIVFYLKDGSKRETYFGWMYKEKNKNKVIAVENQLYEFIDNINLQIKKK